MVNAMFHMRLPGMKSYTSDDNEPYENITRVFWIKIELKDIPWKGRQNLGEIRDVVSGEKGIVRNLFDINQFILLHMSRMGIKIHWFWRFISWLYKTMKS
jgi:hypothetical protein